MKTEKPQFEQHCAVCQKTVEIVREHRGTLMSAHRVICQACLNKLFGAVRDIESAAKRTEFFVGGK